MDLQWVRHLVVFWLTSISVSYTHLDVYKRQLLTLSALNTKYILINCHAPIKQDNRSNPDKVDEFWDSLEDELSKIPKSHVKVLLGDFNAQIGSERNFQDTVGKSGSQKK